MTPDADTDRHAARPGPASRGLSLSWFSLLIGVIFFAASLTPSLIPRDFVLQGVLGGVVAALGYGLGQFLMFVWRYMELPVAQGLTARVLHAGFGVMSVGIAIYFLQRAAEWQNSIRERVGMLPVDEAHPLYTALIAIAVFIPLLVAGWGVQLLMDTARRQLQRFIPRRVANVAGIALVAYGSWALVDGFVIQRFLAFADDVYGEASAMFVPGVARPDAPTRSGSAASLVAWTDMGRWGRAFVASGPSAAEIAEFTGRPAEAPIRIYVGRNSAPTPAERTELAFAEMLRTGAFDRQVLVIAMPVGSGWLDAGSHDPLEFMHGGDIATVAVQYSYLVSWISLVFETDAGLEQAATLFDRVYDHWKDLPEDARPELYLHGISQGALVSMASVDVLQMLGAPIDGALWAGPPFASDLWRQATLSRNHASPFHLPVVGDSSVVRFANQRGIAAADDTQWGPVRVLFLQYGSDPIVFFNPLAALREPEWMTEPPAFDVSPQLRWVPFVTLFQLALDMAISQNIRRGYGHRYIAEDYIPAWLAVTRPLNWTEADTRRLMERFAGFDPG
ncbi:MULTISPECIES: alpha/beta-hydrolase family protein [unclassified Roseitalea]|uniref:alpha/beta hydrolase n=1 Tax=unclassified Roseitalea TaxID=2639107 RepID=UPI00273F87BA|nr:MULTISPECIES: alpha/beta-hydrolase family protein [unclassified Roseitalea]